MAAEFALDLDVAQHWLPLAIIPDIADFGLHYRSTPTNPRPDLALLEDLAQQLTAFGFFDRTLPPPKQTAPLPAPPLRPDLHLPPPPPAAAAWPLYDVNGQPGRAGTGAYLLEPRRGAQVSTVKALPVQPQPQQAVRARPPRAQQRPQANRFVPPVRPVGLACGTGVFLPRLDVSKKKANKNNEGKKSGEQKKQQKEAAAAAAEMKQENAVPVSPTAEMGLPKEWTY